MTRKRTTRFRTSPVQSEPPRPATDAGVTGVGWSLQSVAYKPREQAPPDLVEAVRSATDRGLLVDYEVVDEETVPLTAETERSTLADRGGNLDTESHEAALAFKGRRSSIASPFGGRLRGGTLALDASLVGGGGVNYLHLVGALVIVASVVPVVRPPRRWTAAGAIAGVGLLIVAAGTVAEVAPWVYVMVVLATFAALVWMGVELWRGCRAAQSLESVALAVELAGDAGRVVKAKVPAAAGASLSVVDAGIEAAKRHANVKAAAAAASRAEGKVAHGR